MQKKQMRQHDGAATEQMLGRRLPFNIEAERSILGALLLNDQHIHTVIDILVPNDFYTQSHRAIYQSMLNLHSRGSAIDVISTQDALEKEGQLAAVGGIVYLMSLQEDISGIGLVEQHARIIKEKAILRELITSATTIVTNCYEQNDQAIESVLDDAERVIFDIANKRTQKSFVQLNIWLKRTFQQLSEIKSNREGITGVASGYGMLDEYTSGFQKGDLVVLAARPSMGKTALALRFAQVAAQSGLSVGLFSLEMSAEQLTLRLLSGEAHVQHHAIRNASINSDQWMQLTHAAAQLAETRLFIDDTAMQTVMDIRSRARKLKADHGLDLLVIDYLQLLHGNRRFENRHQEVSEISRALKGLAKELDVPVIALSQLSRAVDSRVDKRPMLSDLRESGAIEQDADVIMFLYRDIVYNPDTEDPAAAELIIGKQRNGPTGTVPLHFRREFTLFEDREG